MNSISTLPTGVKPVDPDLAGQAVPGHGVPSQDPNLAAQVALNPEEAQRESKSVLVGGGLVAGMAAGAAVGAAVAGPVGILVGGTVGAVAGAISGGAAGAISGGAAGKVINSESATSADDAPKAAEDTHRGIPPR